MSDLMHPAASDHLPWFITGPDQPDSLFTLTTIVVIGTILGLGVLFFRLHSLPEHLGHKKVQFEIVAVLGLLSLFTHIHAFWVAGLLLAIIELPDFLTPLQRIAASAERFSGAEPLANIGSEPEPPLPSKPQQPQPTKLQPEAGG